MNILPCSGKSIKNYNSEIFFTIQFNESAPSEMTLHLYNEIFIDLQKLLIGICKVSKQRNSDSSMSYKIDGYTNLNVVLDVINKSYRYLYEVEVPLCLYSFKNEIYKKCRNIMDRTRTLIYVRITNRVVLFIGGKSSDVANCRLEVFSMLENLLGSETQFVKGKYLSSSLIEKGYKVYFDSRINSDKILVSRIHIDSLREDSIEHFDFLYLDNHKYIFLMLYKRYILENLLVRNECYLNVLNVSNNIVKLIIIGFHSKNLKATIDEFNKIYNSIVKVNMLNSVINKIEDVFIYENKDYKCSIIIGDIENVKSISSGENCIFEAILDVEEKTLEFLCGKKNGKIGKIMKDLGCMIHTTKGEKFIRSGLHITGEFRIFKTALLMIYDEFPEQITFNVDEKYHKKIIGFGGKNIQKIMKRHGVYIKFMSDADREKERYMDNVVMKTPRKNILNLIKMKKEIFSLIEEPPLEPTKYFDIKLEDFYTSNISDYIILYDKFKVKEEHPKFYYYEIRKMIKYLDKLEKCHIYNLKNGIVFVKTTLRLDNEFITVANWLITISYNNSLFSIFNLDGSRIFDSFDNEKEDIEVFDCKLLK